MTKDIISNLCIQVPLITVYIPRTFEIALRILEIAKMRTEFEIAYAILRLRKDVTQTQKCAELEYKSLRKLARIFVISKMRALRNFEFSQIHKLHGSYTYKFSLTAFDWILYVYGMNRRTYIYTLIKLCTCTYNSWAHTEALFPSRLTRAWVSLLCTHSTAGIT